MPRFEASPNAVSGRPAHKKFPVSDAELTEEEHSNDKQRWQQQLVSRITQQIKGISSVPASSRGELLQNLADEALAASKECTPQVAKQLLTLADFAGSKKAAQWQGRLYSIHMAHSCLALSLHKLLCVYLLQGCVCVVLPLMIAKIRRFRWASCTALRLSWVKRVHITPLTVQTLS